MWFKRGLATSFLAPAQDDSRWQSAYYDEKSLPGTSGQPIKCIYSFKQKILIRNKTLGDVRLVICTINERLWQPHKEWKEALIMLIDKTAILKALTHCWMFRNSWKISFWSWKHVNPSRVSNASEQALMLWAPFNVWIYCFFRYEYHRSIMKKWTDLVTQKEYCMWRQWNIADPLLDQNASGPEPKQLHSICLAIVTPQHPPSWISSTAILGQLQALLDVIIIRETAPKSRKTLSLGSDSEAFLEGRYTGMTYSSSK